MTTASLPAAIINAGFDIKGLKAWASFDGGGFQYTLLHNGKAVATVHNSGDGGPTILAWTEGTTLAQIKKTSDAKAAMDALVAATPTQNFHGMDLKVDAEWVADELLNIAQMRKVLRKKTLFRLNGKEYEIKAAYDAKIAAYIKGKYPTAIILNEDPAYTVAA